MNKKLDKYFSNINRRYPDTVYLIWAVAFVYIKSLYLLFNVQVLDFKKLISDPLPLVFILLISLPLFALGYFLRGGKFRAGIHILIAWLYAIVLFVNQVYFRYYGSLPRVSSLTLANQVDDVYGSVLGLIHFGDFIFFFDLIVITCIYLYKIKDNYPWPYRKQNWRPFALALFLVVCIYNNDYKFAVSTFFRQGYDYLAVARNYGVLGYNVIDSVKTVGSLFSANDKGEDKTFKSKYISAKKEIAPNGFTGHAAGKDIYIIQVESLAQAVVDRKINGTEITPNVNRLVKESQYFDNNFFSYGLGGTSDIEYGAYTSLAPSNEVAALTKYGNNDFYALPKILKENGYSTYAYHGYNGDFWNRKNAYRKLGFEKFFTSEKYLGAANISMGVNDRDFLEKTVAYIKAQKKPRFSYAITLTSHAPFTLAGGESEIAVSSKELPEMSARYLNAIHYTDSALGNFIARLRKEGLYEDSLFILLGDHTPVVPSYSDDEGYVDTKSDLGNKVPLLVRLPNSTIGRVDHKISNNLDIMPTIMNLLGIKNTGLVLGRDLLGGEAGFFSSVNSYKPGFTIDDKYYTTQEGGISKCFLTSNSEEVEESSCANILKKRADQNYFSAYILKSNPLSQLVKED